MPPCPTHSTGPPTTNHAPTKPSRHAGAQQTYGDAQTAACYQGRGAMTTDGASGLQVALKAFRSVPKPDCDCDCGAVLATAETGYFGGPFDVAYKNLL